MNHLAIVFLALVGLAVGLRAAKLWLDASRVTIRPQWTDLGVPEPTDQSLRHGMWLVGVINAAEASGRLNAVAAKWTAWAVVLGCLTTLVGVMLG